MLNKKIVSLISAIAMTLSVVSFATVANAADSDPAADLTYKVEKNIFDQDTYDAGYQEYTLTVYLKTANMALTDNGKVGALKRYGGTRADTFAGQIKFDTTKLYTDSTMITTNISGGSAIASPLDNVGFTFNWYTNAYTEMIEAEETLICTVNLYAMDAEGNATIGAEEDITTYFSWVDNSRSVSYRTWNTISGGNMDIAGNYKLGVLADDTKVADYVGPLGISTAPAKYNVTVNGGTADVETAAEGDTVTVTPTIPDGKVIDTVTGADGITEVDGKYTFTMPASDVTITITYKDAPKPEYDVTVTGGTADVAKAVEGATVTVTLAIPEGKVLDAISGVSSYTLAEDGKSFTFTMPAEAVTITITYKDAPKPEFDCTANSLAPYYRQATGQVIRRFDCSATNMTEASSFLFTFAKDDVTKPFTAAKPTIGGGASFDFEVMILGAPEGTTLTVTEAE